MYIYIYSFPFWFIVGTELSSLCSVVGLCCLPILYLLACICQSKLPILPYLPLGNRKSARSVSLLLFH